MIKKIKTINEYAVFHDFDWDSNIRDKGNNIVEFKKLNILYGHNYSGKTTLSRIFRTFETGCMHEKYLSSRFKLQHSGAENLSHETVDTCPYVIRVYNRDFVGENLKWLTDEEGSIKPFAILGEKNIEIEKQIGEKEKTLGSEEGKIGLRYDLNIKAGEHQKKQTEKIDKQNILGGKLRKKANEDIKRNSLYNEVTYNIAKINDDIRHLKNKPILLLEEKEIEEKKKLLKEQTKDNIQLLLVVISTFQAIYEKTEKLLSKEIKPTESIQDLLNDAVLQEWVRTGIGYHKEKRTNCAFCGGKLPAGLWEKLDAHFSKESEELRNSVRDHIALVEQDTQKINGILKLEKAHFYFVYQERFDEMKKEWDNEVKQYCSNMDNMIAELKNREKDIFKTRKVTGIIDNSEKIQGLQTSFNELIKENNNKSVTLTKDQSSARIDLRLDDVARFLKGIGYDNEQKKITTLASEEIELSKAKGELSEKIRTIESEMNSLRVQLKDERKGADKVNEYLNHYFGHKGLKLVAVENKEDSSFNFQLMRGADIAHNLSEGECSLVAFCYFVAKLEDIDTKNKELIVWIDDPVSSLDNNHVFFVFSLIESVIARPVKQADGSNAYSYKQLFISTHDLDFLKYLKRLSHPKKDTEFFLIEAGSKESSLRLMPDYLRNYITEFNYLFHQIYKCTDEKNASAEHASFYNFGNNLRKFLEAYLFYKYPVNKTIHEKLKWFFGDDQTAVDLTNRLDNELSHLEEIFDRSMRPIEIPEIPKVANYVLTKIREKDSEQFKALLESIGETNE
ncbi:MAG: AAA family ATPase [Syntrophus sp. (in: bacteria)]|nr:AAA family ATPase [Syntrophus sp. (in: bacteria)]